MTDQISPSGFPARETKRISKGAELSKDYYQYTHEQFRRWAPFYNLFTMPVSWLRNKVVDTTGARRGSTVLDVCTGTGAQAFAFARKGFDVVGVDLSADMLKVARRNNKYGNVRFQVADATKMPFRENCFDVSCISFALHDMPHEIRHEVLDEMKRVSRAVVVVDYHIPDNRIRRSFRVFLTSLFESKYYKDFAGRDLKELLWQHGLKAIQETYGLLNFVNILLCDVVE